MSSPIKTGAVLYAKDVARVRAFYQGLLAFVVADEQADHVVLESPTFQLVIVAIPKPLADSMVITTPPARREATPIKLVFAVPSLAAARAKAVELGGELNPPDHEWRFHGQQVCDGHDPEGNVVQFRASVG